MKVDGIELYSGTYSLASDIDTLNHVMHINNQPDAY